MGQVDEDTQPFHLSQRFLAQHTEPARTFGNAAAIGQRVPVAPGEGSDGDAERAEEAQQTQIDPDRVEPFERQDARRHAVDFGLSYLRGGRRQAEASSVGVECLVEDREHSQGARLRCSGIFGPHRAVVEVERRGEDGEDLRRHASGFEQLQRDLTVAAFIGGGVWRARLPGGGAVGQPHENVGMSVDHDAAGVQRFSAPDEIGGIA